MIVQCNPSNQFWPDIVDIAVQLGPTLYIETQTEICHRQKGKEKNPENVIKFF